MADGRMSRWDCYDSKIPPKHLVRVNNETLLERLVRQLRAFGSASEIIITSHNPQYEVYGATRYEPKSNFLEIDRFTRELIENNVCFLYGDTYYTDEAIKRIVLEKTNELHFVRTEKSIIAVIVGNANLMLQNIDAVTELFLKGQISDCKGWQVYMQYEKSLKGQAILGKHCTLIEDGTQGFNTVDEYKEFINKYDEYVEELLGEYVV